MVPSHDCKVAFLMGCVPVDEVMHDVRCMMKYGQGIEGGMSGTLVA